MALKINGIYMGTIQNTVKHLNVECDSPFIEILPLSSKGAQFNFVLDENFLARPPEAITLTDMQGGYLISYSPIPCGLSFKVIAQKKFDNCIVTCFSDSSYKLSLENNTDFYSEAIDFSVNTVQIERTNNFIVVGLTGSVTAVFVFDVSEKIKPIFKKFCNEFDISDKIITKHCFCDIAKHNLALTWAVAKGTVTQLKKELTRSENFSVNRLPAKILPYAFLEELLVGGSVEEYLSENVKKNADKLGGYLGNFIGVMPPPFFRSPEEVGIILPSGINRYTVEYLVFEMNGRLISNLKKV